MFLASYRKPQQSLYSFVRVLVTTADLKHRYFMSQQCDAAVAVALASIAFTQAHGPPADAALHSVFPLGSQPLLASATSQVRLLQFDVGPNHHRTTAFRAVNLIYRAVKVIDLPFQRHQVGHVR
jgi:hypothetical protein